jgi:hypothetical protein
MARLTERAWKADRTELLEMARRLRAASELRNETWKRRQDSAQAWKEWEDSAEAWHAARDAMFGEAFDRSPDPHLVAIRAGDAAAIETAIRFLEADPDCFHAGYAKERFLCALKVVTLSPDQTRRLRVAMVHALKDGYRHEVQEWCRLGPNLEIDYVRRELDQLTDEDGSVRERARWSLERIDEYLNMQTALARAKR